MKLTTRLEKLKSRLYEKEYHDPGVWYFQDVNILDINPELKKETLVVRKAHAQAYVCEALPVKIKEDELITGNPNQNSVAWGFTFPVYFTKEESYVAEKHELSKCSVWGHHPPAWEKIINYGTSGVKKEIRKQLEMEKAGPEPDKSKLDEYKAMIISLEGLECYAERFALEARRLASIENDPVRKAELQEIQRVCNSVPLNPAQNLHEALQSYWFTYCILNSSGEFIPLGRFDQYVFPLYKKDLKDKKISTEHAVDLIGSFLIKCNERIIIDTKKAENHWDFGLFSQGTVPDEAAAESHTGGYADWALSWDDGQDYNADCNYNYGQSGNDWLMNCIVGGVDSEGNDATNDISYLVIDLMHDMKLLMPTLGARVHKNCPDSFRTKIAEVLRFGQGEPMIYNDDTIIPGFVDIGVPVEDARHYTNDGCWETLIPGKSHFSYAIIYGLQCLEWALFRGKSLVRNTNEAIDTGDPERFEGFEDLYKAFLIQMYARMDFHCHRRLENLGLSYMIAPDPLMSSLTYDCISTGRDISQDGAKYIFHLLTFSGFASVVNSLIAIKKAVFEQSFLSMSDLLEALENNWKGWERERGYILNSIPKFGNDNDETDALASRIMKDYESHIMRWNSEQNKILFPVGIGTFENYALHGRTIGASADGRLAKEALASNYSPTPGSDVEGPTAVIKSVTKPDLLRYFCGCPLDLSVISNEFVGEAGTDRLKGLISSFCELGGQILTITSTNVKDLKDARENPEAHKDLRVRMGGLSAYFIAMSPAQQDNIIKRFDKGATV